LRDQVIRMARELRVVGLMNTQFAIQGDKIFVIEVNPRASRTVPFVSKAIGLPLAKIGARCMAGKSLDSQGVGQPVVPTYFSVKEAVFPFIKFPGVDPILGPEMKSTGEVMGVGRTFGEAFAKSQLAAGVELPAMGLAFISVRDEDKKVVIDVARELSEIGFIICATRGTAKAMEQAAVSCSVVNKVMEGRPHIVDFIKNDQINLIINTTKGRQAIADSYTIRREALQRKVTYTTTIAGASATVQALRHASSGEVYRLQDLHREGRQ
jgi:carbamoyl-phosphate synthase large subunit